MAEIDWTLQLGEDDGLGGRELRGRVNLLHRDGHPIPAEFIAYASRDEEGRFAGANGSVRDMSEQTRLERELRESEERFRFLIENSPDIIFAIDPGGRFTYVSETVRRSLGLEPEELVGTPFVDLIDYAPDDVPGERFAMLAADPDSELTNRIMLRAADGRVLPFEVSSVGVRRDGVFAGIQGAARDITERERLERELRDSEERYRFLVENAPDVVFSTDDQGVFTFVSETIETMTGFTPGELVGEHFSKVVDPASHAGRPRALGPPRRRAGRRARSSSSSSSARAAGPSRSRSARSARRSTGSSPGSTARPATSPSASGSSGTSAARPASSRRARSGPTSPASSTTRSPRPCSA